VSESSGVREGGFTLVEIVIAVAIVATTVAAGFGISLASRSLAVSTAAGEFDQFLDSARTMARDLDGTTLAFTADAYGDGTEVRLLAGGPNSPPSPTTVPPLHTRATIEESESLGKAPFALIVHASGSLSGRPGYRVGDTTTADVGCPASGAFHFVIKAAGGSADRFVPCRTKLAANGPVTLTSWPLAPTAPSPTPCSGPGCTPASLPGVPSSTPSCPPNFVPVPGGCAPAPPSSGARYHVTITGAPPTIDVGAMASFSAQATLTNPNAVAADTAPSLPVSAQTADPTCSTTPSGWQQSGSTFTATGTSAGTCTITVAADTSAVPGATADTATVSVSIAAMPSPAPTASAPSCDLVTNGKCYRRIVDLTTQSFFKYVLPDTDCGILDGTCSYIDSIKAIYLDPAYSVAPTVPPSSAENELLFKIYAVVGVTKECEPYSQFATIPGTDSINWTGSVVGGPADPAPGLGEPSIYVTVNHFLPSSTPGGSMIEPNSSWQAGTNLEDLSQAVAFRKIGSPFMLTFSSPDVMNSSFIQWYPDFPGCDAAGDANTPGIKYGISGLVLQFEVYQAQKS
jgi:type II secretory pathway pseudopilin PulG